MLSETFLREQFRGLLESTRQAEELYGRLAGQVSDPEAAGTLQHLQREKRRHVDLASRLLEILG